MIVLYDAEGEAVGFSVDGYVYAYVKNLQGDVIRILDQNGEVLVKYTYDPWGVPTVYGDEGLAALNPCSYRGYYYDQETGYYYLQSRYYDPEIGRFLNVDDVALLSHFTNMIECNLFSYCRNNPVNNLDSSGYWRVSIRVGTAALILDVGLWALAFALMSKFGTLKWLSKISKAVKDAWDKLIKALAKVIINSLDWLARKLFAGYVRPSARILNFGWKTLAGLLNVYLTHSVGYALAKIIDRFDRDGSSGYLRW